jgi:hypothetical protein
MSLGSRVQSPRKNPLGGCQSICLDMDVSSRLRRLRIDESLPGLDGKNVGDFWAWAYSIVLENVQRGTYAEYLVASALGIADDFRIGWRSYDLDYHGKKIEVKSSAYIQSWQRDGHSTIQYSLKKAILMDDETAAYVDEPPSRIADCYVFSLFESKDRESADVLNAEEWCFYIVSTATIEAQIPAQKTAGLSAIRRLAGEPVRYQQLQTRIHEVLGLPL